MNLKLKIKTEIHKHVYDFKTKSEYGFTKNEINELLTNYPNISIESLYEKIGSVTCMRIDGETIIYPIDIYNAIICVLENRDLNSFEWD